jgi:hypothetical protein
MYGIYDLSSVRMTLVDNGDWESMVLTLGQAVTIASLILTLI